MDYSCIEATLMKYQRKDLSLTVTTKPVRPDFALFSQSKDVADDRELLAVCTAGAVNTPEARIINMMTEDVEHLTF